MTTVQTNAVPADLLASINGKKKTSEAGSIDAVQDRFMTLLVAQMKNQDPLNPLDNAQVTSQLAQLSTVTGIDKLNSTLNTLMSSYQESQTLQAASMIGRGVLTPGSNVALKDSKALFGIEFTEPAEQVRVNITDAAGNIVRSLELNNQDVGVVPLAWDGMTNSGSTAPDGMYKFEIAASRNGNKVSGVNALSFGEVATVSTGAGGIKLNVGGIGTVDMSQVKQIL